MTNHKNRLSKLEKHGAKRPPLIVPYGEASPRRTEMTEAEKQSVIEGNPDKEVIFLHVVYEDRKPTQEVTA